MKFEEANVSMLIKNNKFHLYSWKFWFAVPEKDLREENLSSELAKEEPPMPP